MSATDNFHPRRFRSLLALTGYAGAVIIWLVASGSAALAHEVWIEPHAPRVEAGAPVTADLRIGDKFVGSHLLYIPQQTERLAILGADGMTDITPRVGSRPVINLDASLLDGVSGHAMLIYQSADTYVHYMNKDKFFRFVTKKGAAWIAEDHQRRGLPDGGFIERYKRFAKASIMIGASDDPADGLIHDRAIGMEVEFVLTARTPMPDGTRRLDVQLVYQGAPLADALVTLFTRLPDKDVATSRLTTDADGMVRVTALPAHDYLLDHVTLRSLDPARDKNKAVWESLWASLTFSGARDGT